MKYSSHLPLATLERNELFSQLLWQLTDYIWEFATMPREENTSLGPQSIPSLSRGKWCNLRLCIRMYSWWKPSYFFVCLSFYDNCKTIKPSPASRLLELFHFLLSKLRFLKVNALNTARPLFQASDLLSLASSSSGWWSSQSSSFYLVCLLEYWWTLPQSTHLLKLL